MSVPYFLNNVWCTKRETLDWKKYQTEAKNLEKRN